MTLYAVGDLQGHPAPLATLLDAVGFRAGRDQLWLTGDLVNKGYQSIECLRLVRSLEGSATTVLGNHECKLLALDQGHAVEGRISDLWPLIRTEEGQAHLAWLRRQPFLVRDIQRGLIMTHAGVPPQWTDEQAIQLAEELAAVMADEQLGTLLLEQSSDRSPCHWNTGLTGLQRWRYLLNAFTRMRFCGPNGELEFDHKESPGHPPPGMKPWYDWTVKRRHRLVFGHWSALGGETGRTDRIALDTGYANNGYLTLMNLDTGEKRHCDTSGIVFTSEV